ncbi:MAG: SDR family oxidoreductase [Planctomycetota bacterium]
MSFITERTAVVAGASRGIGLELVRTLAERGWSVHAGARDPSKSPLAETQSDRVRAHTLDLDDGDSVQAFAAAVGAGPVGLLIHNAGVFERQPKLESFETDAFLRSMRTNVAGPVLLTRSLLPNLKAAGGAAVLHISSVMGSVELNESVGNFPYRASKAAMNMVSKGLANELGNDRIASVAMHPGWVRTDMGGEDAPLLPADAAREIADTALALSMEHTGSFIQRSGEPIAY